ncbi:Sbe22p NDAI_0C01690 [Naumovozyma dairenensis CBS 421]|uniref:Protein SBE22 n=1 Tax=Naumovozyma dairenensis (strain ATCC 10597 / BCRC 20456 / CBS 421 / NBRC 0211 / NRRL Y-12639) TaxID=1071378 RepID=G0W7R9_NAUDC|nr:hypothetical protein NDAI_0C01690 [Naumovozyma dairenensis CBS 421]CCD23830.1 hypothetical protein NDAI_0C01690 [Naumovozyma dairenensis CBS 421]
MAMVEESSVITEVGLNRPPFSRKTSPLKQVLSSPKGSLNVSSSKASGLGLRRPSDNILRTLTNEENIGFNPGDFTPPRKELMTKNERPVSNDSIATKSTEIFSSTSSDLNSRSSSIDNEIGATDIGDNDESIDSIDVDSTIDHSYMVKKKHNLISLQNTSTIDEESMAVHHNPTRLFSNGMRAQSQISVSHINNTYNNNNNNYNNNNNIHETRFGLAYANNKAQQNNMTDGPKRLPNQRGGLYGHSNSTSAILANKVPLTPSQRYRLRREQHEVSIRKAIKKKEKYYDEQDEVLELKEGEIDDSLIWNIPMASFLTTSFLSKTPHSTPLASTRNSPVHKQTIPDLHHEQRSHNYHHTDDNKEGKHHSSDRNASVLAFYEMPTSPIPGINRVSDFQYIQQTSKNLSSVYLHSSEKLSKSKLSERTQSASCLPIEFKDASQKGMEDLLLVSNDKLHLVSQARPSWLPPKDIYEKKMHDKEITKKMSMASIEQLDKNKERDERILRDETNKQKYILLLERDVTRNSSLQSCKKMVWETAFSNETRYSMYSQLLQSKIGLITKNYIEPYKYVTELLGKMDFPKGKEVEIEKIISKGIKAKVSSSKIIKSSDLMLLLKLKSISHQGLLPGDELLFHHFLISESFQSLEQVWEIVNLLQLTCFNDVCREKYDLNILNSRGVVAHYLMKDEGFKQEYTSACLNYNTWWNILERIDHSLFMWIIDIIVVANNQCFNKHPVKVESFKDKDWEYYRSKKVVVNYKILLSFALNVLLNYHFGFNDLAQLSSLEDKKFCIPMPLDELLDTSAINNMFVNKWQHYYKKF